MQNICTETICSLWKVPIAFRLVYYTQRVIPPIQNMLENDQVHLHFNFFKNIQTLLKSRMKIFNTSITTVQSLENANLEVWEELITQRRFHLFKTCWKNDKIQLHVNSENVRALLKSHMHIFNVPITIVQSFENVSLKVRAVDCKKQVPYMKRPTILDAVCTLCNLAKNTQGRISTCTFKYWHVFFYFLKIFSYLKIDITNSWYQSIIFMTVIITQNEYVMKDATADKGIKCIYTLHYC
jgi:hypothetical protein